MKEVFIISMARTPIGNLNGKLSKFSAVDLGALAIKGAIERAGIQNDQVEEVFMGNVIQANVGQAPARQVALKAGLPANIPCTTVNKVCSSGMKAIMFGVQSILLGDSEIVVAGGMESMTQAPHYLPTGRTGIRYGDGVLIDGIKRDALQDPYDQSMMGECGEVCAEGEKISREEQDKYAFQSYEKARNAYETGVIKGEIIPIEISQRKKPPIIMDKDEELDNHRINSLEDMQKLRAVFKKDGTVTAGNASKINDGAAALVLVSKEKAEELGLKPLAKIVSYADAAQEPVWFTTAPSLAMPKALKKAGLTIEDIDAFEINEAFSVVALANMQRLDLKPEKVNVHGGAVSIGHPVGVSGCRIVMSLISVLNANNGRYGLAGICNGGGGASAMLIEKL